MNQLRLLPGVVEGIRSLPPELKRKIRAAIDEIRIHPASGKALEEDLEGYRSRKVGSWRVLFREIPEGAEIVAFGPRETIYQDMARIVARRRFPD